MKLSQYQVKSAKKKAKKKETPVLKNVVSLRVSDQEKKLLERLTRATSLNLSDLVREAIGFWLSKRPEVASGKRRTPAPQMNGHALQFDL